MPLLTADEFNAAEAKAGRLTAEMLVAMGAVDADAIAAFQRSRRLIPDGRAGMETQRAALAIIATAAAPPRPPHDPLVRPTTRAEVVERARRWSGPTPVPLSSLAPEDATPRPIAYRMVGGKNGGFDPWAPHPASWSFGHRTPTLDCSGFVAWCWGVSRKQPAFYVETTSLVKLARAGLHGFSVAAEPQPGDVAVFGDDASASGVGHCGVIVAVVPPDGRLWWKRTRVVDCSNGVFQSMGYAISERPDGAIWQRGLVVRYAGLL